MTYPIVGIFESEEQARDALGKLRESGFAEDDTLLVAPAGGRKAGALSALSTALVAGQVLGERAGFYAERVQSGRTLVVVRAPFGRANLASTILKGAGPVDTELQLSADEPVSSRAAPLSTQLGWTVLQRDRPTPLSTFFGIPTLSRRRRFMAWLFGELASPHWTLSSRFDWRMVIDAPAPLSARFNWPVLLANPAPLSSRLGWPLLTSNPAPLSSRLGWGLLSHNPAPLSSRLGWPLLTRSRAPLAAGPSATS
jgi:hypothetical protein